MENQRPVKIISQNSVRAAIWENHGKNGRFYQTTFDRVYKKDDKLENTRSMRERDLADLGFVAFEAVRVIAELNKAS